MQDLLETSIHCPYCGEAIAVLIDTQEQGERYIEDCQVCCRPIVFAISEGFRGEITVSAHTEDDVF